MDHISTLGVAVLNCRVFIYSQITTTSDSKDWADGAATVLQEWVAHIHFGTVIQVEEPCVHIVLSWIQECFVLVIYADVIESRIWAYQCDAMVDFKSDII